MCRCELMDGEQVSERPRRKLGGALWRTLTKGCSAVSLVEMVIGFSKIMQAASSK